MAAGGYYIEASGLQELKEALRGVRGGLKDLRAVYQTLAAVVAEDITRRAPVGRASPKDSRVHLQPGYLRDTVRSGATVRGPWVSIGDERTGYLTIQEFGGASTWRRGSSSHVIYVKPRQRRGYFVWNAPWRKRREIGETLYAGIGELCRRHGLPYDMPANPELGIPQSEWRGSSE